MFLVTGALAVPDLSRRQLWQGLLRKAVDPVPFVRAITGCRVLERAAGHLVREIVLRGDLVRERVTFDPERSVHFERLSGPARGWIENRIEPNPGGLQLRFTFSLEVDGLEPSSPEEDAFASRMKGSYLAAIATTIEATRALFENSRSER